MPLRQLTNNRQASRTVDISYQLENDAILNDYLICKWSQQIIHNNSHKKLTAVKLAFGALQFKQHQQCGKCALS